MDEAALAACMAYVDLSPVRAGIAKTPEKSDFNSLKKGAEKSQRSVQPNHPNQQQKELLPFVGNPRQDMPKGVPMRLTGYLELVDWTGRILREDKRGVLPAEEDKTLVCLELVVGIGAGIADGFGQAVVGAVVGVSNAVGFVVILSRVINAAELIVAVIVVTGQPVFCASVFAFG